MPSTASFLGSAGASDVGGGARSTDATCPRDATCTFSRRHVSSCRVRQRHVPGDFTKPHPGATSGGAAWASNPPRNPKCESSARLTCVFATMLLSWGSAFARPCVFATTHVFARPFSGNGFARVSSRRHVFLPFGKCLRTPVSLREETCFRPTCLREVSSHTHASSPKLCSGSVFARPCVLPTTRVFARLVFTKCRRNNTCLCPTCLQQISFNTHVASVKSLDPGSVLRKCLRRPMCLRSEKCLR